MISQRRIAQCGLLAAVVFFVGSLGIIISQNSDNSVKATPTPSVSKDPSPRPNQPMTLSVASDSPSSTIAQR